MIERILHNPKGEFFFSFLIGIGFSIMLFHKPVRSQDFLAMDVSEIESKMIRSNGKCFKYRVEDSQCEIPISK
jgi:hypothetical protein